MAWPDAGFLPWRCSECLLLQLSSLPACPCGVLLFWYSACSKSWLAFEVCFRALSIYSVTQHLMSFEVSGWTWADGVDIFSALQTLQNSSCGFRQQFHHQQLQGITTSSIGSLTHAHAIGWGGTLAREQFLPFSARFSSNYSSTSWTLSHLSIGCRSRTGQAFFKKICLVNSNLFFFFLNLPNGLHLLVNLVIFTLVKSSVDRWLWHRYTLPSGGCS